MQSQILVQALLDSTPESCRRELLAANRSADVDILEIVRCQILQLPEGPYVDGLNSVLKHIEVAHRHLARGQVQNDETAFTDAIYRANQAFEGSIK